MILCSSANQECFCCRRYRTHVGGLVILTLVVHVTDMLLISTLVHVTEDTAHTNFEIPINKPNHVCRGTTSHCTICATDIAAMLASQVINYVVF